MKFIKFKGIKFTDLRNFNELSYFFKKGILVLLPSGPGLSSLFIDKNYTNALLKSDFNLFDSGLFCILLKFKNINVKKFSGYIFFNALLEYFKKNNIDNFFLIDPNVQESIKNKQLFKKFNLVSLHKPYIAPVYDFDNPTDFLLLDFIKKSKPRFIIINLGGGIQEKIGLWIRENAGYKVSIICSGAAISFYTKSQAPVNKIIDKFYLGWLLRCIYRPYKFIPRYIKSLKFIIIFFTNYNNIFKIADE